MEINYEAINEQFGGDEDSSDNEEEEIAQFKGVGGRGGEPKKPKNELFLKKAAAFANGKVQGFPVRTLFLYYLELLRCFQEVE